MSHRSPLLLLAVVATMGCGSNDASEPQPEDASARDDASTTDANSAGDVTDLDAAPNDAEPSTDGRCVPTTCAAAGAACGTIDDGCGGTLACGACSGNTSCSSTHTCELSGTVTCECALEGWSPVFVNAPCAACNEKFCVMNGVAASTTCDTCPSGFHVAASMDLCSNACPLTDGGVIPQILLCLAD